MDEFKARSGIELHQIGANAFELPPFGAWGY
jgi:hypothetical protein